MPDPAVPDLPSGPPVRWPGTAAPAPDGGAGREAPVREAPVREALGQLRERRGLFVHGPAGIGKSTLLAAVATALRYEGVTVLRCAPAAEDAELPFLGLVDLFAPVPDALIAELPSGPRAGLLTALGRRGGADGRPDRLMVRVAVLDVLLRLAARAPVLLLLDGVQWLDEPSADALAFAVRRTDGADVRIAVARRAAEGERPERADWYPPDTAELAVPPLPDGEVARLLRAAGTGLPPRVLRAVLRTAAGNPFYARELARHAPREGVPAEDGGFLPVPAALRARALEGADGLSAAARRALLVACLADRPTLPLLRAAGVPDPQAALAEAERAGLAGADAAQRVRFRHPLVRAALHSAAAEGERRAAHARLAAAVTEPAAAARHLALAHPGEDAAVAAVVMAAAHAARGHGDPDAAVELAELALRRTPASRPADYDQRLLDAADFACDAGRWEECERAARTVLAHADSPRGRVRARLVLLRGAGQALRGHAELIEEGLRDAAGAPELEAPLYHWAAVRGLLTGSLDEAARHAARAERCAARAGNSGLRIAALSTLARVRSLAGEAAGAEAALVQAMALADDGPRGRDLKRMRAVLALESDRVGAARRDLDELLLTAGESDGVEATVASLVALTRAQVRAGACREALATAARCSAIAAEAGRESAPALYASALAQAFGGAAAEARRLAVRAVAAARADGDQLFLLRSLAVLGQTGLFTGERAQVAEGVESLREAVDLGASMGAADPSLLGWYADLAEALARLGETAAAVGVLRAARRRAGRMPDSVLAALERAEGLCAAAEGRPAEGAQLLRSSAGRLRPLELPVDLARTLTALGTVERRARHRTTARTVLAQARQLAEDGGALPLAERAAAELARVDGPPGGLAAAALTPAEARISDLVRGGATNREVAAQLFISVKTVEGTLSRLYRRFGVRSRTALAHVLASMPQTSRETHP
ncbi:helix-turn-helix transcriptional regulator [Streptomyces sp. NRRL F-5123]|uniref:helix-turn-helix transcriptional regulator n=1 Tax=Streptomyces sp. NRRL F-5123 TaxID=1463856 RepID=UPI000694FF18|nr:LuxR family transcriptional regulator [Streptomyces sp. NRRL F-5123]